MNALPRSRPGASSRSAAASSIFFHGKPPCRCELNSTATRLNHCVSSTSILRRPSALANRRACCWARLTIPRSEEHTSELQSQFHLVCRLLLEKKKHSPILPYLLNQQKNK